MKRIVLFIVVLMLTCAGFAQAQQIDLAALSDEEIMALMDDIQAQIVERHIEGTASLASGAYIAGRDLPAGSYVYTCLAQGSDWGNVTIYTDGGDGDQLFWEIVAAPEDGEEPESFFITLSEGDQLKSDVPFSLTIHAGVRFQ